MDMLHMLMGKLAFSLKPHADGSEVTATVEPFEIGRGFLHQPHDIVRLLSFVFHFAHL
jgi:hypothetical protein